MSTIECKRLLIWAFLVLGCAPCFACFELAASRYQVPVHLLKAIAQVESAHNPRAMNFNTNGTRDIGLMQINSSWLPLLRKMSVTEQALWDPCVNTLVAAWLLSENFKRWGNTYRALGAYHSPNAARQLHYAKQVLSVAASFAKPGIPFPSMDVR
jgi:soluble lytic murein transglycosylase-like protein